MIVKTKNYKLDKKTYINLAFKSILRQQGWIPALVAFVLCLMYIWVPSIWWFIGAVVGLGLYLLFWYIQFYGVTQLDQGKMLFEKFSYEISSQQILMKINPREGMPLKWDQIKRASIGKDHFALFVNKAQLIHLPFKIFNTDNERKFVASILKNKGLVK
ncbi:YcxB family protein [Chryseosolibacter indicus]|uniref:YcxB family protein n=1 Tax=Chryseosolibacter indicus TaxID=2782351 RepID=A0ABS5VRZ3_9BACT|nr:YcxB family protein [Chryseosolibacter indicus]MBT1704192.1 YcxB family protein [Chryseosolibacter indicus]